MNVIITFLLLIQFSLLGNCQCSCDSISSNYTGKCKYYLESKNSSYYDILEYINGTKTSKYTRYSNGNRIQVQHFKDTSSFSWHFQSFSNGNLLKEYRFIKGTGFMAHYDHNGRLKFKGRYRNQKPSGTWKYYDDDNKILMKSKARDLVPTHSESLGELYNDFQTNCDLLNTYSKGKYAGKVILDSTHYYQTPPEFIQNYSWLDSSKTKLWVSNAGDTLMTALPEKDQMIGLLITHRLTQNKSIKISLYFKPIVPFGTKLEKRESSKYIFANGVSGWYEDEGSWIYEESRVSYPSESVLIVQGGQFHGMFYLQE